MQENGKPLSAVKHRSGETEGVRTRPSPARFLLLVNGEHGELTGRIEGVDFMGDCDVRLELRARRSRSRCPRFAVLGDEVGVRISRRAFPILGYRTWVGNWCWDAVSMSAVAGAELLNYLKKLDWECEGGISPYYEMWDKGEKFRPSDAAILTAAQLAARKAERSGVTQLPASAAAEESPASVPEVKAEHPQRGAGNESHAESIGGRPPEE